MPRLHLTDISVRAIRAHDVPTTFWDTALPAFGVRVGKHAKTFLIMHGRDRKRVAIGRYPDKTLKDAREEAKRLLLAPDVRRNNTTVQDVFDTYLDTYVRPN
ncbi:MAG: Arm DNA-binding domain-containing protein [Hyphomicrobiaceae bacterium]